MTAFEGRERMSLETAARQAMFAGAKQVNEQFGTVPLEMTYEGADEYDVKDGGRRRFSAQLRCYDSFLPSTEACSRFLDEEVEIFEAWDSSADVTEIAPFLAAGGVDLSVLRNSSNISISIIWSYLARASEMGLRRRQMATAIVIPGTTIATIDFNDRSRPNEERLPRSQLLRTHRQERNCLSAVLETCDREHIDTILQHLGWSAMQLPAKEPEI